MSNVDNAFIKFTTTISHLQRRASCHRQGQTFQVGRNFLKFLHYIQHVLLQNSWRTTTSVDTSQRQQTSSPPCPQPGFRLDTRSPSVGPQTPRAMSPSPSLFLSLLSFQRTEKNEGLVLQCSLFVFLGSRTLLRGSRLSQLQLYERVQNFSCPTSLSSSSVYANHLIASQIV